MNFEHSDEQRLLADSLKRLVERRYDAEHRKRLLDEGVRHDVALWAALAELGVLALPFAPEDGGLGGRAVDCLVAFEILGAALPLEPLVETLGLAGRLIARTGTATQREALLPAVIAGELRLTLAHQEHAARFDTTHVNTTATVVDDGWVLDGEKVGVLHAPEVDAVLVSARMHGGGIGIFQVPVAVGRPTGLALYSGHTPDGFATADLRLSKCFVPAAQRLGEADDHSLVLDEALDFASVLGCMEAVGLMKAACDATVSHLRSRIQFGKTLGSFQALQHRVVDMFIQTEQVRSLTVVAAAGVDAAASGGRSAAERRKVVSAARIKLCEVARQVGQDAVQLHGGMGMAHEMFVSHIFKRLTFMRMDFGDLDYHLARFAIADEAITANGRCLPWTS